MGDADIPALEVRTITKRFPGVIANEDVNLTLQRGEILALLGENGAGKSTLMNIIYGLYQPTEGEIWVKGKPVVMHSPNDAIALGIGMVHQHFQLVPVMTVAENIMLGSESVRNGFLDTQACRNASASFRTAMVWMSTPMRWSKICPWACASVSRSSRRSTATPTS